MFWSLKLKERIDRAIISDSNTELINLLLVIRDNVDDLSSKLSNYRYIKGKDQFYEIRRKFNHIRNSKNSCTDKAAIFLYLNRNCFNGLWRTNKNGEFNTPYGFYKKYRLASSDELRFYSELLQGVAIRSEDYKDVVLKSSKGDFVYLDPPYYKLSNSNFTQYGSLGFENDEQFRLKSTFEFLTKKGVNCMQTNRACPEVKNLYKRYNQTTLENRWPINRIGSSRKGIAELVITNYKEMSVRDP